MSGFKTAMADDIVGVDDSVLLEQVRLAYARAVTTKHECLLIKCLTNKTKSAESKKESNAKHIREHGQAAKVVTKDWIHAAILKEVTKVQQQAAKEAEKDKEKEKASKKKGK
jgi:hypothetical protein